MPKKSKATVTKISSLEPIYQVWGWIALSWALYRYFFRFPEWVDELIFKPLVFVLPVFWFVVKKEHKRLNSLGLTTKNMFTSIYIGLAFGFVFALEGLAANAIKYGRINVQPIAAFQQYGMLPLLILSLATAFSEELLSRGFIFSRILEKTKNLPYASIVSTLLFLLLHVPILVAMHQLQGLTLVLFFVTDTILGLANSLLYYSTGSLIAPILVHIFWNMTVALYL